MYSAARGQEPEHPELDGVGAIGPSSIGAVGSPRCEAVQDRHDPGAGGHADREAHLVPGPGDRVEDVREDRDDDEPDHDREEHVVAARLALGDRDRDVAEGGRHDQQPDDDEQPPERATGRAPGSRARRSRRRRPTSRRARTRAARRRAASRSRTRANAAGCCPGCSQSAAKIVYAATIPSPTYESFMPIRLWAKSMPSTRTTIPRMTATVRRWKRSARQDVQEERHQDARRSRPGRATRTHAADLDRGDRAARVEREELLAVGRRVLLVVVHDDRGRDPNGSAASA